MRVVVTGASGHLGASLVRLLLERGDRVRVLVHRNARAFEGLDVEVARGDLLRADSLSDAFAGMKVVYHLAGVVSILGDAGGAVPAVNVAGTANAAEAALACGARMVHCSSVHAFDLAAGTGPLDETAPRVPAGSRRHTAYDLSKADGERRVREVIGRGLGAVIVHPTAIIGPWDFEPSRMGRFFIRWWKGTLPALVHGAFDFVDTRDVAGGLVAAAERGRQGRATYWAAAFAGSPRSLPWPPGSPGATTPGPPCRCGWLAWGCPSCAWPPPRPVPNRCTPPNRWPCSGSVARWIARRPQANSASARDRWRRAWPMSTDGSPRRGCCRGRRPPKCAGRGPGGWAATWPWARPARSSPSRQAPVPVG